MQYIWDRFYKKTKGFYPFFKYCPKKYQEYYINKRASDTLGYEYDYRRPVSFNEKIRWLIYNEKLQTKSILTDKIKVKTYITEKVGVEHIAPIYGIWDNFSEIDFSYLPNKFVLKTNNAWCTNLLINSKEYVKEHAKEIKLITDSWLKVKYEQYSLEPQYRFIMPKLFIEQMMPTEKGFYRCDYKVHCFNSEPLFIEVDGYKKPTRFYDKAWKVLPYKLVDNGEVVDAEKPVILEEMLEISKILSQGFSYVRIDFLRSSNKTVVLEMTFTPYSAMIPFLDKKYDFELGTLLKLPL